MAAVPVEWAENFGVDYYHHALARKSVASGHRAPWIVSMEGRPYKGSTTLNVTHAKAIPGKIKKLIRGMKQEKENE